jgi:hypothetical protein
MPLSTGAVVSVTVTLKLADDVLPCESLAVHVTTVVPTESCSRTPVCTSPVDPRRPGRMRSRVRRSAARRPACRHKIDRASRHATQSPERSCR